MPTKHYIVEGRKHEHKGVLFMMQSTDSRYETADYRRITGGTFDHKTRLFRGDNGITYYVFVDWSAREGERRRGRLIFPLKGAHL